MAQPASAANPRVRSVSADHVGLGDESAHAADGLDDGNLAPVNGMQPGHPVDDGGEALHLSRWVGRWSAAGRGARWPARREREGKCALSALRSPTGRCLQHMESAQLHFPSHYVQRSTHPMK